MCGEKIPLVARKELERHNKPLVFFLFIVEQLNMQNMQNVNKLMTHNEKKESHIVTC